MKCNGVARLIGVLVTIVCSQASAQCPFSVSPGSVGVTCSEVSPSSNIWDLSLSITDTEPVLVTVIVGGDSPSRVPWSWLCMTMTNGQGR